MPRFAPRPGADHRRVARPRAGLGAGVPQKGWSVVGTVRETKRLATACAECATCPPPRSVPPRENDGEGPCWERRSTNGTSNAVQRASQLDTTNALMERYPYKNQGRESGESNAWRAPVIQREDASEKRCRRRLAQCRRGRARLIEEFRCGGLGPRRCGRPYCDFRGIAAVPNRYSFNVRAFRDARRPKLRYCRVARRMVVPFGRTGLNDGDRGFQISSHVGFWSFVMPEARAPLSAFGLWPQLRRRDNTEETNNDR
jgi:hypothetical protein